MVVGDDVHAAVDAVGGMKANKRVIPLKTNNRIGGRMFGRPTIEGGYPDFGGQ